ncbi:HAD-IIIC family phosphatase [Spirillospora sp. NPDC029432]|uniref:HAD-IIIC family phosphatase n=1 Tax=Spirillospora sp. NPDC029432 TaxID=3154599 RepID=UPI0034561224
MTIDATVSASFPASPLLRPLRRLCDRLGLDVRFEEQAAGLVHFRHEARERPPDWDVIVLRTADWESDFEENADALAAGLAHGPHRPGDGTIVCLYPSPGSAARDAELAARIEPIDGTVLITPAETIGLYSVGDAACDTVDGQPVYGNELHTAFAASVARVLHARARPPVKAIAVDADYTLWDGACAETEPGGLRLGPGRAAFQELLLERRRQGVLLCLLSQNDRRDVLAAFAAHDFPLSPDDFVIIDAGWRPKPEMLAAAAAELGFALDAFVFIDDNPGECARMRAGLPAVHTLRFPQDDAAAGAFLRHAWMLDPPPAAAAGIDRTEHHRAEAGRRRAQALAGDPERFRAELDLRVELREATAGDVARIVQMSDRVTQFTTRPRRGTAASVAEAIAGADRACLVAEVSDRFGDYGLTGVLEYAIGPAALHVRTWMLSCRVLHREVEDRLLRELAGRAAAHGLDRLVFDVVRTDRNLPARSFLTAAGATWTEGDGHDARAELTVEAALSPRRPALRPAPEPASPASRNGSENKTGAGAFLADLAERLTDARSLHRALFTRDEDAGDDRTRTRTRTYGLWAALLKQAWEDALGIEDLWHHDDLFAVWGATSVDVLKVCAEIDRRCGILLTLGEVLALPTVARQAEALKDRAPSRVPVLTRLHGDGGVPLVFLPPAGGLGYGYLELVRGLGGRHGVLLAQAPELTGHGDRLLDLPSLVRVYRDEIARAAGSGRVMLAGWSFGAVLAYETAVAMGRDGGPVPALLLFDPPERRPAAPRDPGPEPDGAPEPALSRFFRLLDPWRTDAASLAALHGRIFPGRAPLDPAAGREKVWRELLDRLLDGAGEHQRNRLLIPELEPMDVLRGACVWKKNQSLADAYRPTPGFSGHGHVLRVASDSGREHVLDRVLAGRAETTFYPIRPVAGLRAHSAMMEPENVALFAPDVAALLDEVSAARR